MNDQIPMSNDQGAIGTIILAWRSGLAVQERKRRQAGRTPNASRQSTPGGQIREAFGVRPACRRFRTL